YSVFCFDFAFDLLRFCFAVCLPPFLPAKLLTWLILASRVIRREKIAPAWFRLQTPFDNNSSSNARFAVVSPETTAAMSASDHGLPPVDKTPRSSHSNIKHSR